MEALGNVGALGTLTNRVPPSHHPGSAMGNRKGLDFLKRIEGASTHRCLDALTACIEYGAPSCKDAHLAMKPP